VEPGRVDFVSRQDLLDLIGSQNDFGLRVLQVLSQQFSQCVEHVRLLLLSGSAVERLARLILEWGRDFGEQTTDGIRFGVSLTQEEIAQIIGASRETVTRLFGVLKRKRIIGVNNDTMLIRNGAALVTLAHAPR
jgi:CRP/FNR family cyclic AMP-dependent transcriptional regulator